MCGRYVLKRNDLDALMGRLGARLAGDFTDRYNIAPGTRVPVVRRGRARGGAEGDALSWGLVPRWAREASAGDRLANARAEGIAGKASFREAFRRRRCLVPASGFYEWRTNGGRKQPWYFEMRDGSPFFFAGLWESSEDGPDVGEGTCCLITTTPNEVVSPVHDRMPVIMDAAGLEEWMDPAVQSSERLQRLLAPLPGERMRARPVSALVNDARQEGPGCLEEAPVAPEPDQLSLGLG